LMVRYDAAFVWSFISSDKVEPVSFLTALWRSSRSPQLEPSPKAKLYPVDDLPKSFSTRITLAFPEVPPPAARALSEANTVDHAHKRPSNPGPLTLCPLSPPLHNDRLRRQHKILSARHHPPDPL
jgi:hypothetical protein